MRRRLNAVAKQNTQCQSHVEMIIKDRSKLPNTGGKSIICRRLCSLIISFKISFFFGFPLNLNLVWNAFGLEYF